MAKKKLDGRVVMGVFLGIGAASGVVLKAWWALADTVPPFWLWGIPVACVGFGAIAWWERRREHAAVRARLERTRWAEARREAGGDVGGAAGGEGEQRAG